MRGARGRRGHSPLFASLSNKTYGKPLSTRSIRQIAKEALRAAGCTVLAVEQVEGSLQMGSFRPEPGRRYAVVFGNEVKGVQQCVVDACHQALEIPQFGTKHSLNVSVTAGMVMWEFARCLLLSPSR